MNWLRTAGVEDVALRKESVDRNIRREISLIRPYVALRKESVDRNKYVVQCRKTLGVSLSARRAWIEIGAPTTQAGKHARRSPQGERG